ncbi:hypothetical protein D3C85_1164530 [compost metagenome]
MPEPKPAGESNMYVNVTNAEYGEVRDVYRPDDMTGAQITKLLERLRALVEKNGGSFDPRMARLGKPVDMRIIDKPRDLKTIRLESPCLDTQVKEHYFGNRKV